MATSGTAAASSMTGGVMTFTTRANIMQAQQGQQTGQQGGKMGQGQQVIQGQLAAGNKIPQIRQGQPPLVIGQIQGNVKPPRLIASLS